MRLGNTFKYVLPYLVLYRFFAFVIMPKNNHKQSRILFINEAKKLYHKEFLKWFKLTAEINPVLKWFPERVKFLRFMLWGRRLHVLPSVRKVVESHYKSSKLFVVANCGHVVNVEQQCFNEAVLSFMSGTK
jgi:pimeloyl-ACP methyl ester carboxylesterase